MDDDRIWLIRALDQLMSWSGTEQRERTMDQSAARLGPGTRLVMFTMRLIVIGAILAVMLGFGTHLVLDAFNWAWDILS